MTTSLSKSRVPSVSSSNAQFTLISRALNRSHDLSLRYIAVSERFVITLCMSRFDRLSFGSSRTRSVLAMAEPEMEVTVSAIAMGTRRRRMTYPPLKLAAHAGSSLYPPIYAAVSRCLIADHARSKGKHEDLEAHRSIDMPEPSSREMACGRSRIWTGCEAVPQLGRRVQAVDGANDPARGVTDPNTSVGLGCPKRIERSPILDASPPV